MVHVSCVAITFSPSDVPSGIHRLLHQEGSHVSASSSIAYAKRPFFLIDSALSECTRNIQYYGFTCLLMVQRTFLCPVTQSVARFYQPPQVKPPSFLPMSLLLYFVY